jgi:hypothetical protein
VLAAGDAHLTIRVRRPRRVRICDAIHINHNLPVH